MRTKIIVITVLLGLVTALTGLSSVEADVSDKGKGIHSYSVACFDTSVITYDNFGDGIDQNSVFEFGSCGKTVAASIALRLVDEGKISLDDKIKPYLDPGLIVDDARMNDITLRQLLCHTAGFSPSYELGVDKKIYSDPGSGFRYSGVGYIYLQSVIENVTGESLEMAAKQYVFEPLGMKDSTFEYKDTVTPYINLSQVTLYAFVVFIAAFAVLFLIAFALGKITKHKWYSFETGTLVSFVLAGIINIIALLAVMSKVTIVFAVYFVLAGAFLFATRKKKMLFRIVIPVVTAVILIAGFTVPASVPVTGDLIRKDVNCAYTLRSTSHDMSLFCRALMNRYASGTKATKEMFTPQVSTDGDNSWGLGIAIESCDDRDAYWHSGINPGFQSLFVICPSKQKFIVVATNSDNGLEFAKERANHYLGVNGEWEIVRDQI